MRVVHEVVAESVEDVNAGGKSAVAYDRCHLRGVGRGEERGDPTHADAHQRDRAAFAPGSHVADRAQEIAPFHQSRRDKLAAAFAVAAQVDVQHVVLATAAHRYVTGLADDAAGRATRGVTN